MNREARLAIGACVGLSLFLVAGIAWGQDGGPTSVVMTGPDVSDPTSGWADALGNLSYPAAAYGVVHRFLSVLERMVTDTRAWLDRVLDITKGRVRIDHKKTIINYTDSGHGPEDITGEIPRPQRRRDDPGRNGSHEDEPQ